jgi:hypothetical protein
VPRADQSEPQIRLVRLPRWTILLAAALIVTAIIALAIFALGIFLIVLPIAFVAGVVLHLINRAKFRPSAPSRGITIIDADYRVLEPEKARSDRRETRR